MLFLKGVRIDKRAELSFEGGLERSGGRAPALRGGACESLSDSAVGLVIENVGKGSSDLKGNAVSDMVDHSLRDLVGGISDLHSYLIKVGGNGTVA